MLFFARDSRVEVWEDARSGLLRVVALDDAVILAEDLLAAGGAVRDRQGVSVPLARRTPSLDFPANSRKFSNFPANSRIFPRFFGTY